MVRQVSLGACFPLLLKLSTVYHLLFLRVGFDVLRVLWAGWVVSCVVRSGGG